ncbi:unnamed protein product [Closterium sp. Naga37s-1]|nr:unnamed protein product [Closterium sp. Naga37s-1]
MRGGDRMEGVQESAAQEVNGEQGAEADEEDPGLHVKGADEGDGGEDQAAGIDVAEPAQADENAGASQAEESHGRNASRGDEQRAEGSLRQERVAQGESARDAQTQRQRGTRKAERSRTPERGQYRGDWRGGDFRSDDRREEQGGWSGGSVRSPERQQARGGRWKDEPRSPEPHGRQGRMDGTELWTQERRAPPAAQQKGRHLVTTARETAAPRDEQRERAEDARPANAAVGSGRGMGRAERKAPRGGMESVGGREFGVRRGTGTGGQ